MSSYSELFLNAVLLLALGVIYDTLEFYKIRQKRVQELSSGLLVGLLGIMVMLSPWTLAPGIFFDTRWVLISLCGVFFGIIPTLVAVIMTVGFRLFQGGAGAFVGSLVIIVSAVIGLAWGHFQRERKWTLSWINLYLLGLLVQVAILACMLLLPDSVRVLVISSLAPPLLIIFPIVTMLLGLLLRKQRERRSTEKALSESEEKFRILVETSPLAIIMTSGIEQVIEYINPVTVKLFGYTHDEVPTVEQWWPLAYPDEDYRNRVVKEWQQRVEHAIATHSEIEPAEAVVTCKDGSTKNILWGFSAVGKQNWILGLDLTERKRSEEILRESEERFRLLVENAPDAIFARNKRGCFTYLNKAAIALFGATSAQELIGTPIIERYHPKVRETLLRRMQIINEQQFAAPLHQTICLQLNGNEINVETKAVPMHYMGEDGALVFMRDITDRIEQQKRQHSLEKQLHQSQKLESVGTLAGGIAHDFNNVLTGLYGNLALAKMKIADDHPGFRFLEAAEQAMSRTTALTNQLLTFSKGGDPVTERLDLVSLIEEIVNFCLSGSNVKPIITSEGNPRLALVDHKQIQQVFANLTANATEAMPNGGLLTITIEKAELADKAAHGLTEGKYLQITMTDEGTGIDPDLLDRIFDPYFTTKPSNSGLGLATTYSIIDKHGGHISVTSRLGKGTTFTIYLPATEVKEENPLTQPGVTQEPLTQGAKILVMDDEDMIRNMLNEILGELGFAVETAVEGQQAIDMYRQAVETGKPFAIVIMDLTIPGGMGGKEAAKGILQIDPKANIIVSSGYADDPIISNYADHGFKGVASKPYSLNKLSEVLSCVLENG